MPSASVSTVEIVNAGAFLKRRKACRVSCARDSKNGNPRCARYSSLIASTPPNFSIAWRRASVGDKPARRFSAVCIARCSSISACKRSSSCWVLAQDLSRLKNRLSVLISDLPLLEQRIAP